MALSESSVSPQSQHFRHSQAATTHSTYKVHRRNSGSSKRPGRPVIKRQRSGNSKKRVSIVDPDPPSSEEPDDMTTSFPQFCTSCEKQIITPNNTLLYCSESCRRKDQYKPLASSVPTASHLLSRPLSAAQSHTSSEHLSAAARDIIPQRSPTITSNRFSFTDLFSAGSNETNDEESHSEDAQSDIRPMRNHRRQDSEAARYLRQFQSPSFIAESTSRPVRRPNPQSRSSTYSLAPSLTHSPSPGTSPASFTPLSSLPLAYSRPLPPRANPYSQSYGAKGINLVTPHTGPQSVPRIDLSNLPGLKARPTTGTNVGAEELPNEINDQNDEDSDDSRFEKKMMFGSSAPAPSKGALRSLFRFDNMQAPPS